MVSQSMSKPDHFLAALIINRGMCHIRTIVGHYSELLPEINLFDPNQTNQNYLDLGGERLILLQNCLKTVKDFNQFYSFCFEQGVRIDMKSVFAELYNLCDHYSALNYYGKPKYKVHPQVYRDVVKTKYHLNERSNQFNISQITTPGHRVPIELGAFLQSAQSS